MIIDKKKRMNRGINNMLFTLLRSQMQCFPQCITKTQHETKNSYTNMKYIV